MKRHFFKYLFYAQKIPIRPDIEEEKIIKILSLMKQYINIFRQQLKKSVSICTKHNRERTKKLKNTKYATTETNKKIINYKFPKRCIVTAHVKIIRKLQIR